MQRMKETLQKTKHSITGRFMFGKLVFMRSDNHKIWKRFFGKFPFFTKKPRAVRSAGSIQNRSRYCFTYQSVPSVTITIRPMLVT